MSSWWTRVFGLSVLVALGVGVWLILAQRDLMFPRQGAAIERPVQSVPRRAERQWLETSYGNVESWFMRSARPGNRPVLLFFHDRDELIDDWSTALERLRVVGVSVLLVEYPGYGHSAGRTSRLSLRQTATAAYDWVVDQPGVSEFGVVSAGIGLGGAVAAELAGERPVAALILHGTAASTVDYIKARLPAPRFLVRDRFETEAAVSSFDGPVLLMLGAVPADEEGDPVLRGFEIQGPGIEVRRVDCRPDCIQGFGDISRSIRIFLEGEGILGR